MQASPEVVSDLVTIAKRVTSHAPANDVVNRRKDARFAVNGSFVRVHCKTFAVDGATAEVIPSGMLGAIYRLFSSPCEVVNLSKGGMSFETTADLQRGKPVTVSLHVPGHDEPLQLMGEVRWVKPVAHSKVRTVGVQFAPFSKREGCNPIATLDVLRQLETAFAG